MTSPTKRLAQLGLSAKKSLGQHFLHDPAVIERICAVASIPEDATVVEIGPGLGILTESLAARVKRVLAIEKDLALATALSGVLPGNVELLHADALDVDPAELVHSPFHLVSNLPYNVATAILRQFLDSQTPPESSTFMVQREVAQRMVARPPDMNILAVAMQYHGNLAIAFNVGRGAFTPPPRVTSSIVRLIPTDRHHVEWDQQRPFFDLVRAGFSARRKQLRNSLLTGGIDQDVIDRGLDVTGIPATIRPQELDVEDWLDLFRATIQFTEEGAL